MLIGIDEAGRGPIAGPVAVGCCYINSEVGSKNPIPKFLKEFPKGKDSKKMTEKERDFWFERLEFFKKEGLIDFKVALVSNTVIDKKGINKAVDIAIKRLLKSAPVKSKILLDGRLSAPDEFLDQKTIIKGDEKEWIISLASIAAKVKRDRYMTQLSTKMPEYLFERHKGYGTKSHIQAIRKNGISPLHRKTFL
ncbi:MAG: ribonuclease HII [Parcubacteria group bacterium CG11_big_fil_rev_8_21_14_0_20_39_22]|nr:MAG: ribonuclease HII [Parcubacteria group bacterium CG11_big_fil_rev_8_21_14_0_20_39_22]